MAKVTERFGRRLVTGASWSNARTTKNVEFFTVRRANKVIYADSNMVGRGKQFLTEATFAHFFDTTFGGWTDDVQAARLAAERQEKADAVYAEAEAFNTFFDTIVNSGVVSREDALRFTTTLAEQSAAISFRRGHAEGYEDGRSNGYEAGYEAASESFEYDYYN